MSLNILLQIWSCQQYSSQLARHWTWTWQSFKEVKHQHTWLIKLHFWTSVSVVTGLWSDKWLSGDSFKVKPTQKSVKVKPTQKVTSDWVGILLTPYPNPPTTPWWPFTPRLDSSLGRGVTHQHPQWKLYTPECAVFRRPLNLKKNIVRTKLTIYKKKLMVF